MNSGRTPGRICRGGAATVSPVLLGGAATAAVLLGVRLLLSGGRSPEVSTGVRTDDGVDLHVEHLGREDAAVTVVLIHGFGSDARMYGHQCEALRTRVRLLLFDHRGHGRSTGGTYQSATMERLGQDLGEVIDQQAGEGPILLVGHSMGGMAVLSLAGQRPELFGSRVVGVGLLSTAAGQLPQAELPDGAAHVAVRTGLARATAWAVWFLAPAINLVEPFRKPWGRRGLLKVMLGEDGAPHEAAALVQDTWVRTRHSAVAAFFPAMGGYNRTDSLGVLGRIPTLVMAGNDDRIIPWQRGRQLAEELGDGARFVVVPGAGHMVNLTHPEPVNSALAELLDRSAPLERQHGH